MKDEKKESEQCKGCHYRRVYDIQVIDCGNCSMQYNQKIRRLKRTLANAFNALEEIETVVYGECDLA